MVSEVDARRIIAGHLGFDDFALVEFSAGWMLLPSSRGGATLVVEHSGTLRRFPSGVPPRRLQANYALVQQRGNAIEPHGG